MGQIYRAVSFSFGGVEFPGGTVQVTPKESRDEIAGRFFEGLCDEAGIECRRITEPMVTKVTVSMLVPDASLNRTLLDALLPPIRGASDETLARRADYGGRKGRRALRRLLEKGFVGTLTVNDHGPIPCPPVRVTTAERSFELRGRRRQ